MADERTFTREGLRSCPCCQISYWATVTRDGYDGRTLYAFRMALCGQCREPCCPRCEHVAGETVLCTRCTGYPACAHDQMSPEQELYQRIVSKRGRVGRMKINWGTSSKPRMNVTILNREEEVLDVWDEWCILGSGIRSGVEIMEEIIQAALGERTIGARTVMTYRANFLIA